MNTFRFIVKRKSELVNIHYFSFSCSLPLYSIKLNVYVTILHKRRVGLKKVLSVSFSLKTQIEMILKCHLLGLGHYILSKYSGYPVHYLYKVCSVKFDSNTSKG